MVLFFGCCFFFFSHLINDYGHLKIEQISNFRNRHIWISKWFFDVIITDRYVRQMNLNKKPIRFDTIKLSLTIIHFELIYSIVFQHCMCPIEKPKIFFYSIEWSRLLFHTSLWILIFTVLFVKIEIFQVH